MKKFLTQYKWILLIGCFLFSTVLGIYFYTFRHYGLSDTTSVWGSFGSYLGGVLAPILSFTSIVLILYSLKQQRTITDRQKFETNFFKLIELHKNEIHNLSIKKKDLHKYEDNSHMTEVMKSYEVLDELLEHEEKNITEYFNIQQNKNNSAKNLKVFNYRALNNHFIQTRDYLNSIVFSIINILNLIKEAEITTEEKLFYKKVLKSKLRDSEKFFFVIFYIQIHNSIKDYVTREEVFELAGPKEWILQPMILNDNFPFCIPGICHGNSFDIDIPQIRYHLSLSNFLKNDFYYLIKPLIRNFECSKMSVQVKDFSNTQFEMIPTKDDFRNRTWHFNLKNYFKSIFCKGVDLETLQPITFSNYATPYLNYHKIFVLEIEIEILFKEKDKENKEKEKKYTLKDEITFQLQTNGETFININSNKNLVWEVFNWRKWSFREDVPS